MHPKKLHRIKGCKERFRSGDILLRRVQAIFHVESISGPVGIPAFLLFPFFKFGPFKITADPSVDKQQEARVEIAKEKVVVSSDKRNKQTVVIRGDKSVVIRMVDQSIDVLVLPLLSYTLGVVHGISGKDYPASMPIHRLAMASARNRPVRVRPKDGVGVMRWPGSRRSLSLIVALLHPIQKDVMACVVMIVSVGRGCAETAAAMKDAESTMKRAIRAQIVPLRILSVVRAVIRLMRCMPK